MDEQYPVEAGVGRWWMNSTPVESRLAVRHTPPDQQDPVSTVGQVRFLRFAVRHTPPDQQDPVSTVGQVRFLCFAVHHDTSPTYL